MIPIRRPLPAQPLLSFPPDQLAKPAPLPRRDDERPRSTALKVLLFLPLVFVFCLLGFAAYAFVWSLCIEYLLLHAHRPLKALLYILPFSWFLFACGGSFWMAYWRGGGIVPGAGEWKRGDEEARVGNSTLKREVVGELQTYTEEGREAGEEEGLLAAEEGGGRRMLQVKSDGSVRFCRKCNIPKPDRAHHCSSCRRCVLKMDHHCPWLGGGCVGWANYKFFLLALWYTGILGIYSSIVLFHELVAFVGEYDDGFELAPISWALAALLGVIFGVAVGCFGLYHLYLACKNRTTIEAMEHPTSLAILTPPSSHSSHPSHTLTSSQRRRLARAARTYNIYDLGWRENLRQVFGGRERWWEWGCPWGWPPGDGQTFPINEEHLARLRLITEEVYAEAAAGRQEEQAYELGDDDSSASDEDGPVRRA